jgi:hypothetical protein
MRRTTCSAYLRLSMNNLLSRPRCGLAMRNRFHRRRMNPLLLGRPVNVPLTETLHESSSMWESLMKRLENAQLR